MAIFDEPTNRLYTTGALYLGTKQYVGHIGIHTKRHAITIAGSRAGKGVSLIIPNLRLWPHNVLVVDPKGENAQHTFEAREAMGKAVHVIDPFKTAVIPDRLRAGFNPLSGIEPDGFTAREDVEVIADGMVKRSDPKHAQWDDGARDVLAGLIAFVISDAPRGKKNLTSVREMLLQPRDDLFADAQAMTACEGCGGLAKAAGVAIMEAFQSEKSMEAEFLGGARRHSKWIDSPPIASVLGTSDFSLSDIKGGNASVYVVLPPQYLETHSAFMRLLVRCAINAMAAGGSDKGERCLFLLDEFYSLGRIDEIAKAAGAMPSYGVHLWPFLQDLGQLIQLYGREGSETFFGSADAHIFFGLGDDTSLNHVAKKLGNFIVDDLDAHVPSTSASYSEEEKERLQASFSNATQRYQHQMKSLGAPRMPPDQIKQLIAVHEGQPVANFSIVFLADGSKYCLSPQPYWKMNFSPEVMEKPFEPAPVRELPQLTGWRAWLAEWFGI